MNATRLSEVLLMHGKEQWRLFPGNFAPSGSPFLNRGSSVCTRQRKASLSYRAPSFRLRNSFI